MNALPETYISDNFETADLAILVSKLLVAVKVIVVVLHGCDCGGDSNDRGSADMPISIEWNS